LCLKSRKGGDEDAELAEVAATKEKEERR